MTGELAPAEPCRRAGTPHRYTYKPAFNPEQDTVIAHEQGSRTDGEGRTTPPAPWTPQAAETGRGLRLATDELVRLAPRLKPYLRRADPTWPDIVDAGPPGASIVPIVVVPYVVAGSGAH